MSDRQLILEPAQALQLILFKMEIAQDILIVLLNLSSLQTNQLLRPDSIDFIMEAYARIYCRLNDIVPPHGCSFRTEGQDTVC